MTGHKNAILDLIWSKDDNHVFSASADNTVIIWNCESGSRIKKFKGHKGYVNAISAINEFTLTTCSDDGSIKIWDLRTKEAVASYENEWPVTAIAAGNNQIFSGSIDNSITAWDIRNGTNLFRILHISNIYTYVVTKSFVLRGHSDTISGIKLSSDGESLLSNSFDGTLRLWDLRPLPSSNDRVKGVFSGSSHGLEKYLSKPCFSPDERYISCGSGRTVTIWSSSTGNVVYSLPGHKGAITQVDWSKKEPIGKS